MQWAERGYPWQPWKREPPQERPLTGTVTLNKIQWRYLPKRILTWENTYKTTKQGGRRGRKNPQWFARREKLIRYDQQAKLQCNATLAKEHTRSPSIPRGLPRRSRTGVGQDRSPTRSSLTLLKWYFATWKKFMLDRESNPGPFCDDQVQCFSHWTNQAVWRASYRDFVIYPLVKMTWIECVLLSVYTSCVCLPAVWLTRAHLLSTVKTVGRLLLFNFFPLFFPPPDPLLDETKLFLLQL